MCQRRSREALLLWRQRSRITSAPMQSDVVWELLKWRRHVFVISAPRVTGRTHHRLFCRSGPEAGAGSTPFVRTLNGRTLVGGMVATHLPLPRTDFIFTVQFAMPQFSSVAPSLYPSATHSCRRTHPVEISCLCRHFPRAATEPTVAAR